MGRRLSVTCALMGIAVILYPVFVAPAAPTLTLAGCALAALALGLITSRWLGAGIAAGVALLNYALALLSGPRQPDIYAPALAVASWLLLELFDLAVMARRQRHIAQEVLDGQWRRLITTSGAAGVASVAVLLAGVLSQGHPALLPAAALAAAAAVVTGVALTRRAVRLNPSGPPA